ncbi:hypothetical protein HispidOSU_024218, partial [Sigmodon hispidus]
GMETRDSMQDLPVNMSGILTLEYKAKKAIPAMSISGGKVGYENIYYLAISHLQETNPFPMVKFIFIQIDLITSLMLNLH